MQRQQSTNGRDEEEMEKGTVMLAQDVLEASNV
jgi:hypothetical protein